MYFPDKDPDTRPRPDLQKEPARPDVQNNPPQTEAPKKLPKRANPHRDAMKAKARRMTALCLLCALLGGAAGFGGALLVHKLQPVEIPEHAHVTQPAPAPSGSAAVGTPEGQLSPGQVYAANVDACVGITVSTTTNIYGFTTTSAATGSGFVLSEEGHIVTNHHVIEKAAKDPTVPITVTFQNGDKYKAKLLGSEPENDVAVLKIDATGLHAVTLGDSDTLVVGEPVYAIGNPLGELTYTLTDGLVSALDRVITTGSGEDATSMNMLQTNCAINPGNSGGPLFNSRGEVVGIITAKMSTSTKTSATVEGLGFAVPINDVKGIVSDLKDHGYVTGKPYLGITITSVTEADAKRYNLQVGAYVESVEAGSCAEKAGLQVGDIIVGIDDTVVTTHTGLIETKSSYRAGDTATLKIVRDHQPMELQVTFDEEPVTQPTVSQQPQQTQPGGQYTDPFGGLFDWPFSNFFG